MDKNINQTTTYSNSLPIQSTNGTRLTTSDDIQLTVHIKNLIRISKQISLKKSELGLFKAMMDCCINYRDELCYKKQVNLGYSNTHKQLKERQTRTHQNTLIGLGFFNRRNRTNRRLPYEHLASDLAYVYYLIYVKYITDPYEIAGCFARIKKLPVEIFKNCRSQGEYKNNEDKEKAKTFFYKNEEKEMSKSLHDNALSAQDAKEKASQRATDALKAKGIDFPIYDSKLTPVMNMDRLQAYRERHAQLTIEYMRQPSGPRPLEQIGSNSSETRPTTRQSKSNNFAKPYKDWHD